MKSKITNNFKKYFVAVLLALFGFLTSCQTETDVEEHSTKSSISKSSPLTTLIKRVAMHESNLDNIIDDSNYFMIKFPYSVTVNGTQISINSATDYTTVQNNINASTTDSDIVTIHFPVVAILENYTERTLNYQYDYNSLVSSFQSNATYLGRINGLAIDYPIKVNVYNSNDQIANSNIINDSLSLYNFTDNLVENQYFAINYPIQMTSYNGQNLTVNSNEDFENVIKDVLDNCPQNSSTTIDFVQTLTSGSWKISYAYDDGDKTNLYANYNLTFNNNNTVTATKNGVTKNGTWSTSTSNNSRTFNLVFNSTPLIELNELWTGFEFNATQFRFRNTNQGNNETDYLYLQKN
jgi:hypothetical protein